MHFYDRFRYGTNDGKVLSLPTNKYIVNPDRVFNLKSKGFKSNKEVVADVVNLPSKVK